MRLLPLLTAAALLTACGPSLPGPAVPETTAPDTLRLSGTAQIGTLDTGPAGELLLRRSAWDLGARPLLAFAFGDGGQESVALLTESVVAADGRFDLTLPPPPGRALRDAAADLAPEPGCTRSGVNVAPGLRVSEGVLFAELPGGFELLAPTDFSASGDANRAVATYRTEVYLYADRAGPLRGRLDCAEEGSTFVLDYDLDLQAGWNRRTESVEVSLTEGPDGGTVDLRWRTSNDAPPTGWLLDRSEEADLGATAATPNTAARAAALAREAAARR